MSHFKVSFSVWAQYELIWFFMHYTEKTQLSNTKTGETRPQTDESRKEGEITQFFLEINE